MQECRSVCGRASLRHFNVAQGRVCIVVDLLTVSIIRHHPPTTPPSPPRRNGRLTLSPVLNIDDTPSLSADSADDRRGGEPPPSVRSNVAAAAVVAAGPLSPPEDIVRPDRLSRVFSCFLPFSAPARSSSVTKAGRH